MDTVQLIRRLLCMLLLLGCGSSFATYYTNPGQPVWVAGTGSTTGYGSSPVAACVAYITTNNHLTGTVGVNIRTPSDPVSPGDCTKNGLTGWGSVIASCPGGAGGLVVAGVGACLVAVATCPNGNTPDSKGICQNVSCPPSGGTVGNTNSVWGNAGTIPSSSVCQGGCMYSAGAGSILPSVCADGNCYVFGKLTSAGVACVGTTSVPNVTQPSDTAAQCAKTGQVPGTVNGVVVCVAAGTTTSVKSTSSAASGVATSASGVQTSTGTTIGAGTTTTTCAGPTCHVVTQTQVTNPDGSSSTTTSDQYQDKGTYCQQNPNDVQCKGDESQWGGSCGAFTCSGDAVNCAIAQATWKSNCDADASKATQQISDGTNATSGSDFANGDPRITGASISSGLDQTERYSGSCPEDPSFTVMGKTVTVPFHVGCTWLAYLGNAAVAVCLLAGAKIALGGAH